MSDSVCELFGETIRNMFGCGCYYFVVQYLVWLEVLCWIDYVCYTKEYVCCAYDPSAPLDAPSICFVCMFICRMLSPYLSV